MPRKYEYTALPSSEHIRIFVLYPGTGPVDQIRGRLETTSLAQPVVYEALSYTWEDPKKDHTIICDGCEAYIHKNAFEALSGLRRAVDNEEEDISQNSRWIWIDTVCMNQEDVREKNHQVSMMGRIYHQANRTVVWLGPSAGHDEYCIKAFARGVDS